MDNLSHLSYEELVQMEDDLRDILAARALEEKYDLLCMDKGAVELLAECVAGAIDEFERAEADYARRAYERSV